MMTTTASTTFIAELATRLMPDQQRLLFRNNASQWNTDSWMPTQDERGIMQGLIRLKLIDEASGQITHHGLQVVGYLTLTRLRQDP